MGSTSAVAFFRNLNLGHRNSPTRTQLVEAFLEAGAATAVSFQSNGTVVFESASPEEVARVAAGLLTPVCGYDDAVVVRTKRWLLDLDLDEFGDAAEVSLFDGPHPFPEALPYVPARGALTVVRADERHAVSITDIEGIGSGTPVLELLLGVPVTSRGVPTMRRLVRKLEAAP